MKRVFLYAAVIAAALAIRQTFRQRGSWPMIVPMQPRRQQEIVRVTNEPKGRSSNARSSVDKLPASGCKAWPAPLARTSVMARLACLARKSLTLSVRLKLRPIYTPHKNWLKDKKCHNLRCGKSLYVQRLKPQLGLSGLAASLWYSKLRLRPGTACQLPSGHTWL